MIVYIKGFKGPGLMDLSIASFFGENRNMMSEDEEQFMAFIGPLTMGDMFGLMTGIVVYNRSVNNDILAGNTACFDRVHPDMKAAIERMLEKHGGNSIFQ